jgi:hypothetical protein
VVVAGAPGDEYEVTVSSGGQQISERLSFAEIARRSDLGDLSCDALESTLDGTLGDLIAGSDAACAIDTDCVLASSGSGAACYIGCGISPLSQAGASQAQALGGDLTAPVCAALERCERAPPPCSGGPTLEFALCRDGRCQPPDPETLICGDFIDPAAARRTQLRAEADHTCSVDADCRLANVAASCLADCDGAVESVSQAATLVLAASIREIERVYCEPGLARGCEAPGVDCSLPPGPPQAFCDVGTCSVRYIE